MKYKYVLLLFTSLLITAMFCSEDNPVDVSVDLQQITFSNVASADHDTVRTLMSLKKDGELFILTYYGDYQSRLDSLNNKIIAEGINAVIPAGAYDYACSIFAAMGDSDHPISGRNYDNYNVERAVMIGLYSPPDGYQSIGVTNMVHLGFERGDDPTALPLEERKHLLNSCLFVSDGMNEQGVSIALATVDDVIIHRDESKKLINISYLIREVLDHAGNLDEAVAIVQAHDVFDKATNILSHHFLIADAKDRSAIAEYWDGAWHIIHNEHPWLIATNTLHVTRSEEELINACGRYETATEILRDENGILDWEGGMNLLREMSQSGTQWSTVYDLMNREVYISLYRDYKNIRFLQF